MNIKPLSLATIRKSREDAAKRQAAINAKQKLERLIKEVAHEIYPHDLFMRDRNVAKDDFGETTLDKIQSYMGKLETSNDIFAPWSKIR